MEVEKTLNVDAVIAEALQASQVKVSKYVVSFYKFILTRRVL